MSRFRGYPAPKPGYTVLGLLHGAGPQMPGERPAPTPYQVGRKAELQCARKLRAEGRRAAPTAWSQGIFDVEGIANRPGVSPTVRAVQVKSTTAEDYAGFVDGVRTVLAKTRHTEGVSREVWLWIGGRGFRVRAQVQEDGRVALVGMKPHLDRARAALERVGVPL